jgi:argininosuccinate lyase
MLSKCKIIPTKDAQRIVRGLEAIARDLDGGKRLPMEEDIHYALFKPSAHEGSICHRCK